MDRRHAPIRRTVKQCGKNDCRWWSPEARKAKQRRRYRRTGNTYDKRAYKNDFQYGGWNSYTLQCSTITKWQHPAKRDTWLWDDMPLNSPKRPPYRNSTSGCDHITAVDMSFCTSLKSDHPRQKEMTSCRFSRWRFLSRHTA